jgi:CDP-glycerol glycerophosphotransferase (TagB/SpsB family)
MTLRHLILHNFWLKLFSIVMATVIWLGIHYSIHEEMNINQSLRSEYIRVPVSIKTTVGDKRVFRITPDEVVVTAVGEDDALLRATRKDIRVNLDLTDFNATQPTSKQLMAEAPPDIKVLAISPPSVEVQKLSP